MDLIDLQGATLRGLDRINVILGKNGCGKSFLLKKIEPILRQREGAGQVRYLTPERGGWVEYNADMEFQIGQNPNWLPDRRRQNQSAEFRSQSAALFRRAELIFLRGIEKEQSLVGYVPRTFDGVVDAINELLERVRIRRDQNRAFTIEVTETGEPASARDISSGEAEREGTGE